MRDITRWDPLAEAVSLRQMMDRLFEDSFVRPFTWRGDTGRALRPPLDIYSTDEDIVILMSVPGVKPEDVDVTVEGDTVTIRGEIKPPIENVDYVVQERATGPFRRVVTLNVPVEADKAEASFKDGVLTLTLPKAAEIRPRSIKVQAGG
ncbi:MAG: Hsp20/alpha crystallin family protein [Anaerolineae bacterium]|nr:Hsp20/alpha crystallin family protein [Anaerolineae bacterium]